MADPLSVASGIIAVVTATVQATKALYETIDSYKSYPRRITELKDQLQSLIEVLSSLRELLETDQEACLPLKFPLQQCCAACQEFKALLENRAGSSGKGRPSFAEWMRFEFRSGDVVSFTESIAGYKLTISIAIADANLRTSKVTLKVLNEYRDEVESTTKHLKGHLEEIKLRLDSLAAPQDNEEEPSPTLTDWNQIINEQSSTETCLQICRQFQTDLNQMQFKLVPQRAVEAAGSSTRPPTQDTTWAKTVTLASLESCKETIDTTVTKLTTHQRDTAMLLQAESARRLHREEENKEVQLQKLESELNSADQLISFCQDASSRATPDRVHILEDISVGHNSQQLAISTVGDLFKVRGASTGDGSIQIFGTFSAGTIPEIFKIQTRHREIENQNQTQQKRIYNAEGGYGGSRIA